MKLYLKSYSCISAQNTFSGTIPKTIETKNSLYLPCITPDYKEIINPKLLRRMSPIIKNGVAAGITALQNANVEQPDAIIIGTHLGCLRDTENFLKQLIIAKEELPNPTQFIQSTHNTVAGQIALILNCNNYNFTFSQGHNSFECALLDAQLFLLDKNGENVLVGGTDEMPETIAELVQTLECYKDAKIGEGASFFTLSTKEGLIEFKGVRIYNKPVTNFNEALSELGLSINDINIVIGGDNSENDKNYASFKHAMREKPYIYYKPFIGEFGTASAQALWLGCKIIEEQDIPDIWRLNSIRIEKANTIMIYNNVGDEQSIMVISKNNAQ